MTRPFAGGGLDRLDRLDTAGLVVLAGQVLGIGTDAALARVDVGAARAALDEASAGAAVGGAVAGGAVAGGAVAGGGAPVGAAVALVHALLRHPPFPDHRERVAIMAGLQFLSLNGWQADLDPPAAAAVAVEALASGRLSPDGAVAWLSPRLSPRPEPLAGSGRARVPVPGLRPLRTVAATGLAAIWLTMISLAVRSRMLVAGRTLATGRALMSGLLAIAIGGLALLATACSHGPATAAAAHPAGGATRPSVTAGYLGAASGRVSPGVTPVRVSELAWAGCAGTHGVVVLPGAFLAPPAVVKPGSGACG